MVVGTITSGLGNQLFQYAIARHLSVLNHTPLYFDTRFYRSDYAEESGRSFKLDKFNIDYREPNSLLYTAFKGMKLFPDRTFKPFFVQIKEKHYHFDPDVLKSKALLINLKGYWHSEKYFKPVSHLIRNELTFNNVSSENFEQYRQQVIRAENSVAVHIRRGDYVNHPEFSKTFGFLGLRYYESAIALIKAKLEKPSFFLFTDDKQWVKDHFNDRDDFNFVELKGPEADLDDLHLMSLCKHNIIANSSYSWWGAWLNRNDEKVVLAPKDWFRNQPLWDTKDLLPESWIKI